ncbi:uncharacterized protein LOC110826763 isoform X2 [Zootermopsis nevadensis]|uniref:uncharacterized protein LOC110826763 isoform X2 n=1 Tax=Zootermopsis nevadensis TaxID=136037 RepID=UPI000B8EBF58|nr:uncharacterized protein LOC110826763 isoform X2 [Zootermopsis nevadensis]
MCLERVARYMTSSPDKVQLYLPVHNEYVEFGEGLSLHEEITRYIGKEFPHVPGNKCSVYCVPKQPIHRTEQQGRSYGGKSFRKERNGKLMMREHDYVIFTSYNGNNHVTLVEVKSTCDASREGMKISDAKAIKNSKRSAQHQLRDHVELLQASVEMSTDLSSELNCFIFWPFLSCMTKDPQNNTISRWKEDGKLHVFMDAFETPAKFIQWFQDEILRNGNCMNSNHWDVLLKRFIVLSCGVYVDEIHEGMLALLSQEQVDLLNRRPTGKPLIIHGAAGTGKTMLTVRKLQQLYEDGQLHENSRALYICYWPGIRCDVVQKLEALGISEFVDTQRFFISTDGFLKGNKKGYKHIFMDESEAICLSFEERIITQTFEEIFKHYHMGNPCAGAQEPGVLWFLVDINQASLFLPKHSPNILKTPDVILTNVVRSTGTIYRVFKQFYQEPVPRFPAAVKLEAYQNLQGISIAHNISGPPIYWVDSNSQQSCLQAMVSVILDLCSTKGIKPNDLCVLPFFVNSDFRPDVINREIENHFVDQGFMPQALANVESFLLTSKPNNFLVPWVLRVKGLEFKVVVMVIDDEDFDFADAEDRRKVYIMVSRCTCLLVLLSSEAVKNSIDKHKIIINYPFSLKLP